MRTKYLPVVHKILKEFTLKQIKKSQFIWTQTDGWKSKAKFKMIGIVYSFIIDYTLYIVPIDCVRLRGKTNFVASYFIFWTVVSETSLKASMMQSD